MDGGLARKVDEWEVLAKEPERTPMKRTVGPPTVQGRVLEQAQEISRLRDALRQACAALRMYA